MGDILEDLEELMEEVHKETMPPQIPSGLLQFQQKSYQSQSYKCLTVIYKRACKVVSS